MRQVILLALLGSATVAAQDIGAIKGCVDSEIAQSTAKFHGSASCPAQCAHCHSTTPEGCPGECRNKNVFCGCSAVIFQAITDARICCSRQSGLLTLVCSFALDEVTGVVGAFAAGMCNGLSPRAAEATPSLADIVGSNFEKAASSKMALLQGGESASAYVHGHSKGAACVDLLESMEREQAEQVPADEMPDLRAVAVQIAEGSSGILGREMPELKDKVHRAMASAWTEEGPGMDADRICEVVLRHHDSL